MDNVPEGQYDNPAEIEPNQKAKNGEEQPKKAQTDVTRPHEIK